MPGSEVDLRLSSAGAGALPSPDSDHQDAWQNFRSAPERSTHQRFFNRLHRILTEYLFEGTKRESKVASWKDPSELKELVDLQVGRSGSSHETLIQLIKDVIKYSVTIGHPYFVNQLFSSVDPYGLAGQWVGDVLNPSVYTYEVSPVFTIMEETVLAAMRNMVGYTEGDGIFCPGGSIANGYAMNCARFHKFPQVKTKGLSSVPRLVVLTSEEAHYSIQKMASLEGIGSENVLLVRTHPNGKMDVRHLEQLVLQAIEENAVPFMVSATAGTTVLGAFDPIEDIWKVCQKYKMWLHVDAAWGGGALMSKRHRHLLSSIEKADSITWNPHKMLAAPQQCSTMLTRHRRLLTECHSAAAQYLFQKDKFYDTSYDTGDKHIQCGRRADVLKFWLMWKAKGSEGFEKHVDVLFDNAKYFTELIRNREGFELVVEHPECTNVAFWYVPPSLRDRRQDPDFAQKLHRVAPLIKERMMREGTMMMTYQPQKDLPNFFRLVLQSSALVRDDMDRIAEEIERLARDL